MEKSTQQRLSDAYIANLDIIGEGLPAWVNEARRGFLESFNLTSLPSIHDERYRHTDLHALFAPAREQYFTPPCAPHVERRLPVERHRVDVVNGFCVSGLTMLDNGVIYGSLREAMAQFGEHVETYYNTVADNEREEVTALNSLFMQDGAFVYVPDDVNVTENFVLTFEHCSAEAALFFDRALVVLGKGARADVIVLHQADNQSDCLVNFVREGVVGAGAVLNLSEISDFADSSALISGNYIAQYADSKVNTMNVWLRGGTTRVNANVDLREPRCENNMYGLWFGTGRERTDIDVSINHLAPDCTSSQLMKSVVSHEAVGAFTGRVYVARDAQRTVAQQQSRNLQMSDGARIFAEPQLEIYADDVKCSHGATVGQTDTEALYYMRQRGLSEQEARRLQMFGFVNDIISRCPHEGVCDFIAGLAEERISEL